MPESCRCRRYTSARPRAACLAADRHLLDVPSWAALLLVRRSCEPPRIRARRCGPGLRPGVLRAAWGGPECGPCLSSQLAQPCRCLCRGSEQMTMTRPCRRMIRHLLQIFFTLGLTFTTISSVTQISAWVRGWRPAPVATDCRLLVAVDDPAATQVIRAQLDDHPVVGQDPDIVHPHLAADMSKNLVPVVELHPEEGVGQRFDYRALNLDGAVFLGHILRASLLRTLSCLLCLAYLRLCLPCRFSWC